MVQWNEAGSLLTNIDRFPEFCERFVRIRPKQGGALIPLRLNMIQWFVFKHFMVPKYKAGKQISLIILKARQWGGSTLIAAFQLWLTLGHANYNTLVVGREKSQAKKLFRMIKIMNDFAPWGKVPPDVSLFPYFIQSGDSNSLIDFSRKSRIHQPKMKRELKEYKLRLEDMLVLNSSIEVASAEVGDNLGRSGTYQSVWLSEVAKWEKITLPVGALRSCCHPEPETMMCLESTANGMNEFYHLWENMTTDEEDPIESEWDRCFIPFYWDDKYKLVIDAKQDFVNDYEEDLFTRIKGDALYREHIKPDLTDDEIWRKLFWRRRTIRDVKLGDLDKFNEDYPSTPAEAFISSGQTIFNRAAIRAMAAQTKAPKWRGKVTPPTDNKSVGIYTPSPRGELRVWEEPLPNDKYIIFVDIAEGKEVEGAFLSERRGGYDSTCAQVIRATAYPPAVVQAAMWHGDIDPDLGSGVWVALARKYNNALLAWEANKYGRGVAYHVVRKYGYTNIYRRKEFDTLSQRTTLKVGWWTDHRSKSDMVVTAIRFIREREVVLYDSGTITELNAFTQVAKEFTSVGCHDDRVMALMGALVIADPMLAVWNRQKEAKEITEAKKIKEESRDFDGDWSNLYLNPYLGED